MKTKHEPQKSRGTLALLEKVAPNLYRNRENLMYYGRRKIDGKRRLRALETADRKVADRKLAEWLKTLAETDASGADLTLAGLFARARATFTGKPNTLKFYETILRHFENTFERGMSVPVVKVRPSEIAAWFTKHGGHMRHLSFNGYRRVLAKVFWLAVVDRVIPAPGIFSKELVPRKKKQDVVRNIPTADQLAAILGRIRGCKFNHGDAAGADAIEFLALAGMGTAEAAVLRWEDIDWTAGKINVRRVKTQKAFTIPLFSNVRAFLEPRRKDSGKLFKTARCHDILTRASAALGFLHFTPRNLRSFRIVAQLDAGVDVKQVAEWQGHSDGGKLIMDTYSNVIRANKNAYEAEQIARAEGKIVRFQNSVAA